MDPSPYFSTLSNIVSQNKKVTFYALEINMKSGHAKCSIPVTESEIFPVPPSTDEWNTWNILKEKTKCFGYISHTDAIT